MQILSARLRWDPEILVRYLLELEVDENRRKTIGQTKNATIESTRTLSVLFLENVLIYPRRLQQQRNSIWNEYAWTRVFFCVCGIPIIKSRRKRECPVFFSWFPESQLRRKEENKEESPSQTSTGKPTIRTIDTYTKPDCSSSKILGRNLNEDGNSFG